MGNQPGGTKATFSPIHGSNVELLRDGVVATRKDKKSPSNAVLYTEQPIPVGCKFEVKLEEKVKYFNSSLKIGFALFVPEGSSEIAKSSDKLKTRFDHWILIGSSVWNGNVHWALKYDLETLNQGDIIGCRVREGGRLCFYVNGEYKRYKGQALSNLPDNEPLYGFVELCGDAVRVRALPVVDRSGGKGSGYSSGGGSLRHHNRTLSTKQYSLGPAEAKKKSSTLFVKSISEQHNLSEDSINRSMTLAAGGTSGGTGLLSMNSMRWKNRAFGCFHERASPNIIFKENRGVAVRMQPGKSNGFVFTQEPIRLEEKFVVRLIDLSEIYHVSLGIGVTTLDPASLDIPQSSLYLSHNPDYWVAISDTLRHNGVLHKLPFDLDKLKNKSRIGIMVKFNGDLHMFVDDKDQGKICGGVSTNMPLFGFVDLAGQAVKIRSMFYSAKSATMAFKEHGKEVEGLCQQIANEVVTLITMHFQTENAASTQLERTNSLVEMSLGRSWQTGSFAGGGENGAGFNAGSKFTLSFMEKLQRKVQSKPQQLAVNTKELEQSLQKSLASAQSDTEPNFNEEDEETMRQLLNPVAGDAEDLASQIVDRIPDNILGLLNLKLTSSQSLPSSATDPLESARAIILEVLVNGMSSELLDEESSATPARAPGIKEQTSIKKESSSPIVKKAFVGATDSPVAIPDDDTMGSTPHISAQLVFRRITTTVAHAVIEKLNAETIRSPLTSTSSEPDEGPSLPRHGEQATKATSNTTEDTTENNSQLPADDNMEYEEHVMIVTYGSFADNRSSSESDDPRAKWRDVRKVADIPEETIGREEDQLNISTSLEGQYSNDTIPQGHTPSVHQEVDDKPAVNQKVDDAPTVDQEAGDTPTIDQKAGDTPTIDQKAGDTPVDQKADDKPAVDQKADDKPAVDQKADDTPIVDQKANDTPTIDQKSDDSNVAKRQHTIANENDLSMKAMSPEEMSKLLVTLRPYLIPQSDLICNPSSISKGAKGCFRTTTIVKWHNTDCSLHEFNLDFSKSENKHEFGKYLSICVALSKLRHPNIQQLLGFVSQEEDDTKPLASIVTELVGITLTKLLNDRKSDDLQTTTHINICYDVAKAVSYLHSKKISHLLIRSDCILMTRGYLAKLSDIATSQFYQHQLNIKVNVVNKNYLPPQAKPLSACDTNIDIFSLGVLFLQTITHIAPNPAPTDDADVTEIQRRQDHIDLVHSSHPLLTLILTCLADKPEDRPTDKEICGILMTTLNSQD